MKPKIVAAKLVVPVVCFVLGYAGAYFFDLIFPWLPSLKRVYAPVAEWLAGHCPPNWSSLWEMVGDFFPAWLFVFACGVVLRQVLAKRSPVAALCFAVGYLACGVVAARSHPMLFRLAEQFGGDYLTIVTLRNLTFVPMTVLGAAVVPNLRRWKTPRFTVRGLLLTMFATSVVVAVLTYGNQLVVAATLLALLSALAGYASWRVRK